MRILNSSGSLRARRLACRVLMAMALLVLTTADAFASHFRYATISAQPVLNGAGQPTGQIRFQIKSAWRRSFFGALVNGNTFNPETFFFGDGASQSLILTVTSFSAAEDWVVGETTITHQYPAGNASSSWIANGNSGARIANLNNGSNGNWYYDTLVRPYTTNSSPTSALPPIVTVPKSTAAQFFVPASDVDRDTLFFRMSTNAGSGTNPTPPGFTINSSTGLATWNNNTLDTTNFWFAQIIVEDRDGAGAVKSRIPVDVLLKIVAVTSQPPTCLIDGSSAPKTFSVQAGNPVSFTITGGDPDGAVPVTLNASGKPGAATLSPAMPFSGAAPISSTFNWTPTAADAGSRTISFSTTDNTGLVTLNSVNIFVENNQPPTITGPATLSTPYTPQAAISVQVADPNGDPLTVTWELDGVVVRTDNVPASQNATTLTYTGYGAVGPHTVKATVKDTKNATASLTTAVTVTKADQTIDFTPIGNKTFGDPAFTISAVASSGLPVVFTVVSGPATVLGSTVTLTGAGPVKIAASQAGDGNFNPASVDQTFTVAQASATIVVNGFSGGYDGNPHGASGTATGLNGENLTSLLSFGASFTSVPGGTAHWTFAGNANYGATSGDAAVIITQVDATIAVSGYTGIYDGDPHGATGTAKGVKDEDLSGLLSLGASYTSVPGGTATWAFAGNTNYKAAGGTAAITITQADASVTVNGYNAAYDGNPHGATGTAKGVKNEDLSGLLSLGATFTNVPGGTATWSFAGNTNYKSTGGSATITITQADATIAVVGHSGAYDGNPHGATGTATGVKGESLTALLSLGASYTNVPGGTAMWAFAGNTNYKARNGTAAITITQADATVDVTGYNAVYDGNPHGATGTAKGVKNEDLSALLSLGASFTSVPGGTATWSFAGDTNYKSTGGSATITITQADATIAVVGHSGTYDGNPHGATGTAKGVNGESLTALLSLGASFTNVPGGTANWAFAGDTNYKSASGSATITLTQADATIDVDGATVVYDGNPHGATGTAKGVKNESLTALLSFGDSFTSVPGGTATWAFAGDTNYKPAGGTAVITITQANATIDVTGYNAAYDGNPHAATGTAKGVKGESLTALLSLGASFTTVPGGTATWAFAGDTNYKPAGGTAVITITQANAAIVVNGPSVVYDGDPHGATGTATGVKGESLTALLSLGASYTNVPGGTAAWTFAGDTNYKPANGTAAITITQAGATVAVNGYTGIYDGNPHGATGTAKGVKNEDLTPLLSLGTSFTNAPGGPATWAFAGDTNYKAANGTAAITITQADATVTVNGYSGIYDGNPHGATGNAKGVKNEDLTPLLSLGASFTNAPGGPATWAFAGNTNYKPAGGTAPIAIAKAPANVTVNGYSGVYDTNPHGATGGATGVKGESLTSLLNLGDTFTNVPGGTAHWIFAGNGNYDAASGDVAITLTKTALKVTADNQKKLLGAPLPAFTASYAGFIGGQTPASLGGSLSFSTPATAASPVGSYSITPAGLTSGNYAITFVPGTLDVTYNVCLGYDDTKAHLSGSTIPIKLQLCDASGIVSGSSVIVVHATQLVRVSNQTSNAVEDSGNANPDDDFRLVGPGASYMFNLKTTGLTTGTYNLLFTVTGDPQSHAVKFAIR